MFMAIKQQILDSRIIGNNSNVDDKEHTHLLMYDWYL